MDESDDRRALTLLGGLGLGALAGVGLGFAFGPAGRRLRGHLVPLVTAAAGSPAVRRLLVSAAERAGLRP
jgi:hypothetical protein